jgi:hypothetical protein
MTNQAKYFVLHLDSRDYRPFPEAEFEVQLLNADGEAAGSAYLKAGDVRAEIDGESVPEGVVNAAKRQPLGSGDYVDKDGNSVPAF